MSLSYSQDAKGATILEGIQRHCQTQMNNGHQFYRRAEGDVSATHSFIRGGRLQTSGRLGCQKLPGPLAMKEPQRCDQKEQCSLVDPASWGLEYLKAVS